MRAIGTSEALDTVEEVRTTFTEAIQVIPPFEDHDRAQELPPAHNPDVPLSPPAPAEAPAAAPEAAGPEASVPESSVPDPAPSVTDSSEPVVFDLIEPEAPPCTSGVTVPPPIILPDTEAPEHELSANAAEQGEEPPAAEPPSTAQPDPELSNAESVGDLELPSEPIPTPRLEPDESVIIPTATSPAQRIFSPEISGLEPAMPEHRSSRSFQLFWLWFAANSSVLGLILGVVLLSLGMSLRQAILAALVGVAMSFLPTGLATLASKWNGQPTIVVSRASFGMLGNALPSALALITRLLWGAALLWLLAEVGSSLLEHAGVNGSFGHTQLAAIIGGGGLILALVITFFGYRLIALTQLVLSVASSALIIMLIVVTWPQVNMANALTVADGPWVLVVSGAIIVFSFIGIVWASASGDVARYQRPSGSGASAMLSASFASAVPPFLLIGYGAMLASSDSTLAEAMLADPASALASIVPEWFLLPLVFAVGAGLLSGVILSVYSGGFAVQALGVRMRRDAAVLVVGVVTGVAALALTATQIELMGLFRDVATTIAVPTAAWIGIFSAEMMIRSRRFEARSLVQRGGVYPAVNWVNLSMFVVASAIGFGFTTATEAWLSWQGYFLGVVGLTPDSILGASDLGVVIALAIGLLTPLVAGVRSVRRQETKQDPAIGDAAEAPA